MINIAKLLILLITVCAALSILSSPLAAQSSLANTTIQNPNFNEIENSKLEPGDGGGIQVEPPQVKGFSLAEYLMEMLAYLAIFKNYLVKIIDPLIGYFQYLSYIVLILVSLLSIYKRMESGFDIPELFKFAAIIAIGFLLINLCGDTDGDGRRGDLLKSLTNAGKSLAYGSNGDRLGVYLTSAIEDRRKNFDESFETFAENKMMVKINDRDMPIQYPGDNPEKILIAIQSNKDFTKSDVETQVERMSWYLSALNTMRGLVHGADIFLLLVNVFLILGSFLVTPLMFAFLPDENWRKKITYQYLWSLMVLSLVFPLVVQTTRFLIFSIATFGVGINSENPFFRYDAATKTFIASGNPEPFIWIALILMGVALFIFVMSLVISWKLMQGSFLETVAGIASSALATQVSAGLGIGASVWAQRKASEARETELEGNLSAEVLRGGYQRKIGTDSAESGKRIGLMQGETAYQNSMLTADAERASSQMKNQAGFENSQAMAEIEKIGTVQSAFSNLQRSWRTADKDAKVSSLMNAMEFAAANGDTSMKEMVDRLNLVKDKKELLGKMVDEDIAGAGFFGKLANTLGFDGKTYQSWQYGKAGAFGEAFVQRYLENKGTSPEEMNDVMSFYKGGTKQEQDAMVGMIFGDQKAAAAFNESIGQRLQSAKGSLESSQNMPFENSSIPQSMIPMRAGAVMGGMNKQQKANYAALQRITASDPNFLPTLERESLKRGIAPDNMLNMLAIESSFNKTASNPFGYIGMGQVGRKERRSLGWSGNDAVDLARLKDMSPSEQLSQLVFPFVDTKMRENPALKQNPSMARLYSAWGDGKATFDDNRLIKTSSGAVAAPGTMKYNRNRSWDANDDGRIQQWEFGQAAQEKLGAGTLFSYSQLMGGSKRRSISNGGGSTRPAQSAGVSIPFSNGATLSGFSRSGGAGARVFGRSGGISTISLPKAQSSPEVELRRQTDLGNFVSKGLDTMQNLTPAQAEVFGKEMTSRAQAIHDYQKTQKIYDTKEKSNVFQNTETKAIEFEYARATEQNARQKQSMQIDAAQNFYYSNESADNVLYQAKQQTADLSRRASFAQTMDTYQTSLSNTDLSYRSSIESANIIHNAQLKALQQNNVSRLIENIGGTLARQTSELFEKAGRF